MATGDHLLIENNVISLRTAFVTVIDGFVLFSLSAADPTLKWPKVRKWLRPQDFDWMSEDRAILYRQGKSTTFTSLDSYVRQLSFKRPPEFKFVWVDSGQSVALYLNGEPWAFIDEASHCGFSKGMLKEGKNKRLWDQQLFEKIFLEND